MRSLYLKIFLWFWVTVVCLLAVSIVVTYNLRRDSLIEPFRISSAQYSIDAQTAAFLYERHGHAALNSYLTGLGTTSEMRSYLFDNKGHLVGGPRPNGEVRRLEQNALRHLYDPGIVFMRLYRVQPAEAPSGHWYTLISEAQPKILGHTGLVIRWIAVVLTATIICLALTRHITAPIGLLRAATRQIAQGRFSTRIGDRVGRRGDELGMLAQDFDKMAAHLETLLASQQRLLADISHELRSPLARLNVALEIARRDGVAAAPAALDRIERESQRLNELIAELTAITRLDNGIDLDQAKEIDIEALVRDIVADTDFEAKSHGNRKVRLATDRGTSGPMVVYGEQELLRRAIENVIRNAVRYTAEGTAVEVNIGRTRRGNVATCLIMVRDHGPGVPETAVRDIFKPFFRLDAARDRKSGGVGLGLAIVDRAVTLHGGAASAANAADGGLSVSITLPLNTPGKTK